MIMRISHSILRRISARSANSIVVFGGCAFLLVWMIYHVLNEPTYIKDSSIIKRIPPCQSDVFPSQDESSLDENTKQACTLPKTDPFETKTYSAFLKTTSNHKKEYCWQSHLKVFESSLGTKSQNLLMYNNFEDFNLTQCSYRYFFRSNENENDISVSAEVFNITEEITEIPLEHEFISIKCIKESNASRTTYQDMHAFVPLLNITENEKSPRDNGTERTNPPNVVILLLDSVSRMSFIRTMPLTYAYLTKDLNAIELKGFVKVGDNTLPNILPLLTSNSWSETESPKGCVPTVSTPFDNCPFIWKDFKKHGYVTSFAEDADIFSSFSYYGRRGFAQKPTDSYLRPFIHAANSAKLMSEECIGSQNRIEFLLEYMKKVAVSSNLRKCLPYFQLIISAATHDSNIPGINQDEYLEKFLKWFQQENHFNNTIFILMSDHGSRWGKVFDTPQGYIESRMPFAFFLLPKWFQSKFPLAVENLMKNRNRLITTFDFYHTLKDILTCDTTLVDSQIKRNTNHLLILKNHTKSMGKLPRGISLFLPIPLTKTCSMAGITGPYCVCNLDERTPLDVESEIALSAADETMKFINERLSPFKNICIALQLDRVKSTSLRKDEDDNMETIDLIIVTQPGGASFEGTLTRKIKQGLFETLNKGWKVVDELARTDYYRSSSLCVKSKVMKMYCICKEVYLKWLFHLN